MKNKTMNDRYTECRIQWIDDLSEMDVLISAFDECENDNDNDIFFYGMSREKIVKCMQNGVICEGEWKVIDVYG